MRDFMGRLRPAMCLSVCRASYSGAGPGRFKGEGRRMAVGTVSATNCSRLAQPTAASIQAISAGQGPMWRASNSSRCSRAARAGLAVMDSVFFGNLGVGGGVQQGVEVGGIDGLELEQ